MLLPGRHIASTCYFMVLIAVVISYPYPEDDKTFDLKIGFDITHGENAHPSLRIRDFEGSREFNPRAADDASKKENTSESKHTETEESEEKEPKIAPKKKGPKAKPLRVGSNSDESSAEDDKGPVKKKAESSEGGKSKEEPSPVAGKGLGNPIGGGSKSSGDSADSVESDTDTKHSTRGLRPGEYEPEEKNPKMHDTGDDDEDRRRRVKRAAANIAKYIADSEKKRKLKKFRGKAIRVRKTTPGY